MDYDALLHDRLGLNDHALLNHRRAIVNDDALAGFAAGAGERES